jgi:hypothetical protein
VAKSEDSFAQSDEALVATEGMRNCSLRRVVEGATNTAKSANWRLAWSVENEMEGTKEPKSSCL